MKQLSEIVCFWHTLYCSSND